MTPVKDMGFRVFGALYSLWWIYPLDKFRTFWYLRYDIEGRDFKFGWRHYFSESKVIFGIMKEQGLKAQVRGFGSWAFQVMVLRIMSGVLNREVLKGKN